MGARGFADRWRRSHPCCINREIRVAMPSAPPAAPSNISRGRVMKISFAEPDQPRSGAVVVGVWEEGVPTPAARRLDEATDGAITRALSVAPRFKGKKDELLPIVGPANAAVSRIVLAGLGKTEAVDARMLQQL